MTRCRNLLTDVPGLRVGSAHDPRLMSGVTVVVPDRPVVAALDVRGGGPGTRESDALSLAGSVDVCHAIVLSGGSAFGLSAASAVQTWLAANGVGFPVGSARVPIVPQAILFDLLNGGEKPHDLARRYEELAREACETATQELPIGSRGAGFGATTATLRGGLGSASAEAGGGRIVGALAAVNAVGSATMGESPHFWAAPFEVASEFGGHGPLVARPDEALPIPLKGTRGQSTTLAVVATNARLDKRQALRLAVMAQAGLARALYPVHTPLDGDAVFALAMGDMALDDPYQDLAILGAMAANTLARAIARSVYEAEAAPPGWNGPPAYRTRFGRSFRHAP